VHLFFHLAFFYAVVHFYSSLSSVKFVKYSSFSNLIQLTFHDWLFVSSRTISHTLTVYKEMFQMKL
jgi:hypothetical protein